mgnify:CR=1 FL=1
MYEFLLQNVTKTYGLCPYLLESQKNERDLWLNNQSDKGKTFEIEKQRCTNNQVIASLNEQLKKTMESYEDHVRESFTDFERLKTRFLSVKRKSKELINETLKYSNEIKIDLFLFFNIVYDIQRYKKINDFDVPVYVNQIKEIKTKLNHEKTILKKEIAIAKKNLDYLVTHQGRRGKYFNITWSSLKKNEKADREKEYCEWARIPSVNSVIWEKRIGMIIGSSSPSSSSAILSSPSIENKEHGRLTTLLLMEISRNRNKNTCIENVMRKSKTHVIDGPTCLKFLNKTYVTLISRIYQIPK